ncbi:tRNA-guanine transglycosylase DpdA [Nannocystis sp. SCPEA4]|uniref:tRNA-guanine transglycosylase DpdA n=1 Tax=Nannocystis sp. SCPEA4 TaxID=2996787 RepID=UPI00226FF126|nr:tRNA-guanine transglycosylase DpdA [Nannocystis sp. SCPEA4]MCY1058336.1 tRNA-guanine transglycosylase DpdA [Nannocystis sp. SCPEA4]
MKYFLPDSQDLVDPSFDFQRETRDPARIRHQDDYYAHEVFKQQGRAFDGVLVSKAIVEGTGSTSQAKYTQAQQRRILREGVKEFLRLNDHPWGRIECMGDCGAFTYVNEDTPPFSVDDVVNFYVRCGFDYGFSVDHVIVEYKPQWDTDLFGDGVPPSVRARQALTLNLAAEFLTTHRRSKLAFTPIGIAQGWSPASYAHAFAALQKIGYRYIALGGMVSLKTQDILSCLKAISTVRLPETRIHLLGVTRFAHLPTFASLGVWSIDSTSPLRQAFMDDKDNYHTLERTYTAIRVPQVQGNFRLEARIRSGELDYDKTRKAEQLCLRRLEEYDASGRSLVTVLKALRTYEEIHDPERNRTESARLVLEDSPWKKCPCAVCKQLRHHVILFRGAERNRRRGFHNVAIFYQRLRMLKAPSEASPEVQEPPHAVAPAPLSA